ncbi:MAG: HTH domain-containing protein [Candidatus Dormibacteraeota bacterium]|nr:HTH domain-containing protein [Candidatus Dormibacteraeota bacterium]
MNRAQRFSRLLSILSEVVRHPGRHPADLAAACGVSERTLRRDLHELREMGFELGFIEGFQLQERFDLDGTTAAQSQALPLVYEQQLKLLRSSFPAAVAQAIQASVEEAAPAALARLFTAAIQQTKVGNPNG